jgi:hypothetical protein
LTGNRKFFKTLLSSLDSLKKVDQISKNSYVCIDDLKMKRKRANKFDTPGRYLNPGF